MNTVGKFSFWRMQPITELLMLYVSWGEKCLPTPIQIFSRVLELWSRGWCPICLRSSRSESDELFSILQPEVFDITYSESECSALFLPPCPYLSLWSGAAVRIGFPQILESSWKSWNSFSLNSSYWQYIFSVTNGHLCCLCAAYSTWQIVSDVSSVN